MAATTAITSVMNEVLKRASEEGEEGGGGNSSEEEKISSWALFIMIMLLIAALFMSYLLQQKKVEAVHETVISIFAGMGVGLILSLTPGTSIQGLVKFDYQIFFNLLLPPIILASGYELHQANFFRHIGTILTFAFAGTFISAIVLGMIIWIYTRLNIEGFSNFTFVEAISFGATLSATDPVTILAIFNTYKVDPKLYTIIFGESILNDAVAIVLFETAQRYKETKEKGEAAATGATSSLGFLSLLEGIGIFLGVFFGSLIIGMLVGIGTALMLKYTYVRRFPKIESCLIILIAYASYFFSNAISMSGIVTLLFCGITLKHYAYYNMSRRTQLTTKYLFQVLSQLSENFIFIYLGLSLFTDQTFSYKPLFIIVTVFGICVARYAAVFPLSKGINWFIRYRARSRGQEVADEIPFSYQAMLFWAGLRGAVGVALAAGMTGTNGPTLKATVLVVVVLTVIIFGGTTARMLEILGIRTGVVEEIDSDDEFDIEAVPGGSYYKNGAGGIGNMPARRGAGTIPLSGLRDQGNGRAGERGSYSSGNASPSHRPSSLSRKGSAASRGRGESDEQDLLHPISVTEDSDLDSDSSDLPPAVVRRSPNRIITPPGMVGESSNHISGKQKDDGAPHISASAAFSQLIHGTTEDHAAWFKQLDDGFIKPTLLLDGGKGPHNNGGPSS